MEAPEVREVIVGTSGEGSQLMLAWDRASGGLVEPSGIWKVFLFTDDAAASYDGAIATGATPVTPPKHLDQFRITIAPVEDPDGYLIEIGQRDD